MSAEGYELIRLKGIDTAKVFDDLAGKPKWKGSMLGKSIRLLKKRLFGCGKYRNSRNYPIFTFIYGLPTGRNVEME